MRFWSFLVASIAVYCLFPVDASASEPIELQVSGPIGPLVGTFVEGAQGAPIVLIIPGSGPTDRDGNSPVGVKASTYKLLAEELAKRGVSSFRIDKRGMFGSSTAIADPNDVKIEEYVQDVIKWAEFLAARSSLECVWLAGHSEGGLVALVAATKEAPICGTILLAAPGRPFGEILRDQLRANPANQPIIDEAFEAIRKVENGERFSVRKMHPSLQQLFDPAIQNFLIDISSYSPVKLASRTKYPLLIIQPSLDLQVSIVDAIEIYGACMDCSLFLASNVTHVLKEADGRSKKENLRTYTDTDRPLSLAITGTIVDFVLTKGYKSSRHGLQKPR